MPVSARVDADEEVTGSQVTSEPFTIRAADGYTLAANRYTNGGPATATIIVAGATGVRQGFYRRFAEFATDNSYEVVTFDYRGIGRSAPARLRGFDMHYNDWAQLDLAAFIDNAPSDRPLFIVGHSYGGVAFGLVPNIHAVDAIYAFGAGAGWHGWMSRVEAVRVLALWHVVGPVLTRVLGYMPGALIGLGSDMPLGVYRTWKRWARFRRCFFDDPYMDAEVGVAAQIRIPVAAANSIDDPWAPPRSRDALMSGYEGVALSAIDIDPARRGLGPIGHVGYFRPAAVPLWNDALDWLEGHRRRMNPNDFVPPA